jgi:hypothetical protein
MTETTEREAVMAARLSVLFGLQMLPPSASRYRLSPMFGGPNTLRDRPALAPALKGGF